MVQLFPQRGTVTENERCHLLSKVYFKKAVVYAQLWKGERKDIPNMTEINKSKFFGTVRELKVG